MSSSLSRGWRNRSRLALTTIRRSCRAGPRPGRPAARTPALWRTSAPGPSPPAGRPRAGRRAAQPWPMGWHQLPEVLAIVAVHGHLATMHRPRPSPEGLRALALVASSRRTLAAGWRAPPGRRACPVGGTSRRAHIRNSAAHAQPVGRVMAVAGHKRLSRIRVSHPHAGILGPPRRGQGLLQLPADQRDRWRGACWRCRPAPRWWPCPLPGAAGLPGRCSVPSARSQPAEAASYFQRAGHHPGRERAGRRRD